MKIAICLLVLLPLAYCASIDERFVLDSFGLDLNDVVQKLQDTLGSDTSEAACELACPTVMATVPGGAVVAPFLCSPACKELQVLISG